MEQTQEVDRNSYLGASDMAAILGENPYVSPMQVYANKIGMSEPFTGNEFTWLGSAVEPEMRKWYREEVLDGEYESSGEVFLRHPELEYLAGHPDDILSTPGGEPHHLLEIKTVVSRNVMSDFGLPFTDEVPRHYLVQCLYYLMLADLPYCDLSACFVGDSKRCFRINRSPGFEEVMVDVAERFWTKRVQKRTPPDVIATAADSQSAALDRIFAQTRAVTVEATPEVEVAARQLQQVDRALTALQQDKEHLQAQIKLFMAEAEALRGTFGKINWKPTAGRVSTSKLLEALVREFQVPKEYVEDAKERFRGKSGRTMRAYWTDTE